MAIVAQRIDRSGKDGIDAAVRMRLDENGEVTVDVKVDFTEYLKRMSPQNASDESAT